MDQSTTPVSSRKSRRKAIKSNRPPKPDKDFPLYAHPSGRWCRRIRGQFYYFGKWGQRVKGKMERLPGDTATEALRLYKDQIEDILAGRTPGVVNEGELTTAQLCDEFINSKIRKVRTAELSPRTLVDYRATTDQIIKAFGRKSLVTGLRPSDFAKLRDELAQRVGPVRLGNELTRIKSVFKYAADNDLVTQPIKYGSEFAKPSKKAMRQAKTAGGKKLFAAAEVQTLLAACDGKEVTSNHKDKDTGEPIKVQWKADPQMRAMVLLGLNCAFGNNDVSSLQTSNVDLKKQWVQFPRPKTGIDRRCPLWPETVTAIEAAAAVRPAAKAPADADCVFLTSDGTRMVRLSEKSRTDYVSRRFKKLLEGLGINGRKGLNFYSLRHTFVSIALEAKDRSAVKAIMGHDEGDILASYDETGPSDARLQLVTDHVRGWLWGKGGEQ
jgi:integrase